MNSPSKQLPFVERQKIVETYYDSFPHKVIVKFQEDHDERDAWCVEQTGKPFVDVPLALFTTGNAPSNIADLRWYYRLTVIGSPDSERIGVEFGFRESAVAALFKLRFA